MGLDYMVWRRYIPRFGVFTSVDPLADEYPGISPYAYALNNPLIFIDPDGREVQICTASGDERDCITYTQGMDASPYEGNMFVYNAINSLNQIMSSSAGMEVLPTLVGSENVYSITNSVLQGSSGSYSASTRTIRAETILGLPDNQLRVEGIGHELFHAYQHEVGGVTGRSINAEVEAYVFQGWLREDLFGGMGVSLMGRNESSSGLTYRYAYDRLLDTTRPFSHSAYESAINNFREGSMSNIGGTYNSYPVRRIATKPLIHRFYRR